MGRFDDRLTHRIPGPREMLKILRTGGLRPPGWRHDAAQVPCTPGPPPAAKPGEAWLTWVGHASFVVQMGGLRILTDPVWARRLAGNIPRMTPPGVPWDALGRVDAAVVSHDHYDHLDAATLRRLARDTPVFVPLGTGDWMRRRRFTDIRELDWWESADLGGVAFTLVPAHHWCRRGPFDRNKRLWGGWIIEAKGTGVYFAGDTAYGHWFKDIGKRFPRLDAALLPIGSYEPRWFMQRVHMSPEDALQAFQDLGARRLVAMHWGTFPLTREPVLEPPARMREAWRGAGLPEEDLWVLAVGGSRRLA